jgi:hypothetical protein
VLLHENTHLHTAAHTQALLEHFNLELFDHPPYSLDLALIDYHSEELVVITVLNNNELMECVKMWLSSQACKNLFPNITGPFNSSSDYVQK